MTTITENEKTALICCVDPKGNVESMIEDQGQVMSGLPEMMEVLGWNKKQVAALIGSLEEKGMGYSDENEGNGHIFWPSEKGYQAAYDAIKERQV